MADFSTLLTKIKAKVAAQTNYFAQGSVFDYEPDVGLVTQDPWATVIPSGNENDFASTMENKRSYGFLIRVFVERNTRGNDNAETLLRTIIDVLLDAFDQDYTLTGTALMVSASPSKWGYVQREKEYRVAEILIQAKTWFDVTT